MIDKKIVEKLVSEHIEGTALFLVEVIVGSGNNIQVLIDSFEGVSIDRCVEISRFLNDRMDREEQDYSLEVSSPGIGSPLRVRQQFEKNVGRDIEVVLFDGSKKRGKLLKIEGEKMEMEVVEKIAVKGNPKKKKSVRTNIEIEFKEIKTTKAVISFK
jgi:ribosome maturation factor RimP